MMTEYGEKLKFCCIRALIRNISATVELLEDETLTDNEREGGNLLMTSLCIKVSDIVKFTEDSEIEACCKRYFTKRIYEKWIEEAKNGTR